MDSGCAAVDPACPFVLLLTKIGETPSQRSMDLVLNNGCIATGRALVEVVPSRRVYVSNAFTPDFDGVNDYFTIYGVPEVERVFRLQVFDRWGGLVFDATDLQPGESLESWDGTVGSRALNPGTCLYLAEVVYLDGAVQKLRGDINLIR